MANSEKVFYPEAIIPLKKELLVIFIDQALTIENHKSVYFLKQMTEVLKNRLDLFSSEQKTNLSALYNKLETVSEELIEKFDQIENTRLEIAKNPGAYLNLKEKLKYIAQLEKEAKNLLVKAINLNKLSIEKYKIVSVNEMNYITALGYIKQIYEYLQEKFADQITIDYREKVRSVRGYTLDFIEDCSDEEHYFNISQAISALPDQDFNINLIQPISIDLSKTTIGYADSKKGIEVNISLGQGYQTFTSSCQEEVFESMEKLMEHFTDQGFEALLRKSIENSIEFRKLPLNERQKVISESFEQMLKGVLVIARELKVPLKLLKEV